MPIGTFQLPALDVTVTDDDGTTTYESIRYAQLHSGPRSRRVFMAFGYAGQHATVPDWATRLLEGAEATAHLYGYPRQVWTVDAHVATSEERVEVWPEIKQARPDLTPGWDLPEVVIVVLDLVLV